NKRNMLADLRREGMKRAFIFMDKHYARAEKLEEFGTAVELVRQSILVHKPDSALYKCQGYAYQKLVFAVVEAEENPEEASYWKQAINLIHSAGLHKEYPLIDITRDLQELDDEIESLEQEVTKLRNRYIVLQLHFFPMHWRGYEDAQFCEGNESEPSHYHVPPGLQE
ncbi:hypothetical protein LTS18_014012, partial [Coniosporium uncinatum]